MSNLIQILAQLAQMMPQQTGALPASGAPNLSALSPSVGASGPAQSTAATPSFMPGGNGPTNPMTQPNPLMGMAQRAMTNPMANTIPQQPQPIPAGSPHPLLQKILQSLGTGMQNMGYGMMTGTQQQESQALAAQKADAAARLAETQQWHEMTSGIAQERAGIAEQQAQTAEHRATTAEERVKAYQDLGQQRLAIEQAKSDWQKDIAEGRLDQGYAKLSQQANQFEAYLSQRKALFEQDLNFKQEVLQATLPIKQAMVNIANVALQQRGTDAGIKAQQALTQFQLEHPILTGIIGLPDVASLTQSAEGAGIPGVPSPSGAVSAPTTGTPLVPTPPVPTPARPTPAAKANAKNKPNGSSGGSKGVYNPLTGQVEWH